MSSIAGLVEIEKRYPVGADRLFAAWASAEAILVWSAPPPGWEMRCTAFRLEAGHADEWHFGPIGETPYVNVNRYSAIEQGRRIVYTTTLSRDGRLDFAGAVCVTFEPAGEGCRLLFTETGAHIDQDDREGHLEGWKAMLDSLGAYLDVPAEA